MELKDLNLFSDDSNDVWGIDKDGNEYTISYETGNLIPVEKGSIDLYWGGCTLEEAKAKQAEIKAGLKK
jgi:hypothetical protein